MRVFVSAALLLALLAPAAAQDAAPAGPLKVLEDGTGDVATTGPNGAALGAPPRMAATDLKGLEVEETPLAFVFRLSLATLADDAGHSFMESIRYDIQFRQVDTVYSVSFFRQPEAGGSAQYFSALSVYDPDQDSFHTVARPPLEVDTANAVLSTTIPRDLLLDSNGAKPFPGNALDNFQATSGWFANRLGFGFMGQQVRNAVTIADRMPDEGNGTIPLAIRFGIAQSGSARLYSDIPTRASNGEATTIVYTVQAVNIGDRDDTYRLETKGVPADWTVRLPAKRVELPAGSNVSFPVLLSIPFDHQHGQYKAFTVEMTSETDKGSVGRVELGVRFLAIPQPTGHHSTVWLHSTAPDGDRVFDAFGNLFGWGGPQAYFNAQPDDAADAKLPVYGNQYGWMADVTGAGPVAMYQWYIPLSPGLQLGLDFDLTRSGVGKFPIASTLPIPGAVLTGDLVHFASPDESFEVRYLGRGGSTLARLEPSAPTDIDSDGTTFELQVVPTRAGDYVPFIEDAGLALRLNLTFVRPDVAFFPAELVPKLLTGGEMTLPLNEYHDPVDDIFTSVAELVVLDGQERKANAGETAVFKLQLRNLADQRHPFHITVNGLNSGWARVAGGGHVPLGPGGQADVYVIVDVPATAAKGDVADLVVEAASMEDVGARTLARVYLTVTDEDVPDQKALAAEIEGATKKDTPGASLAMLALALAALALVRARRA